MLPARAWTRTAQSGVECADCDATSPSQVTCLQSIYLLIHTDLVILNLYYFELISSSPLHLYHVRNSVAPWSLWSCRGTFKRTMCRNSKGLSLFLGTMLLKKVHHKYVTHYQEHVIVSLPSSCRAFSQAFVGIWFRWRILKWMTEAKYRGLGTR